MSKERGVTKHRSMDDWLRSKPPGKTGGGKFLTGWKDFKAGTGTLDTWLHTQTLPMTVWRHSFPMLIIVKDKKTGADVTHVWGRGQTCHETEDVLDKLYWREERGVPSSERTAPPERCAMCKLAEWCWQESWAWVDSHTWDDEAKEWKETKKGKGRGTDPCDVLFKFVSEADDKENTTIHVGGFCGLFGRDKDMPEDLLKAMAASKIRQREAWKENCMVKAKSVMCVVDNDDPGAGVQISEETKELGEKVKKEILKQLKSNEIDIQKQPYCIRWEYDKSKQMGQQYEATAMMKIKPTPRILALIRSKDKPDTSALEKPFKQQELRGIFERHCKLAKGAVPWNEIFPTKEQEAEWAEGDAANTDGDESDDAERGTEDRDSDVEGDNPADDVEVDDDGVEQVACDECGKAMAISAAKCPHCGHVYEVEEEEVEEEEPPSKPKMRTRAEVAAEKKAAEEAAATKPAKKKAAAEKPPLAKAKTAAKKPEPEPEPSDADESVAGDDDEDDDQDGSIPF
jgi:hypothetical protein